MSKLEEILGIPCTQLYTDEYLEIAVVNARAEALRDAEADNERLREAGNKMARFISTWQDCLEGVQMTSEDFNENCGLSDWLNARATLVKED